MINAISTKVDELSEIPAMPDIRYQYLNCFHCGRITRIAIAESYVDWEKEYNELKLQTSIQIKDLEGLLDIKFEEIINLQNQIPPA